MDPSETLTSRADRSSHRIHPKRCDGTWPPLARSPRVFASATAGHAIFGALLGWALSQPAGSGSRG